MATKAKKTLSINTQYDYITMKTPNGNFTANRSGYKATGQLAKDAESFNRICRFIDAETKGSNTGSAMNQLLNPSIMAKLFPGYDKIVVLPDFKVGARAKYIGDYQKYQGLEGVIKEVTSKYVRINMGAIGTVGFPKNEVVLA